MSDVIEKLQGILKRSVHLLDWLDTPFQLDGWLIATNGHALIALKSDEGSPFRGKEPNADHIRKMLDAELGEAFIPLAVLRAIGIEHPAKMPCDACHGSGYIDCPKCEGAGWLDEDRECWRCTGQGEITCTCGNVPMWGLHRVWIDGALFDRTLIGTFLIAVNAERFRCSEPRGRGFWVIGDEDWRLVLMPMLTNWISEEQLKAAPRLWITKPA